LINCGCQKKASIGRQPKTIKSPSFASSKRQDIIPGYLFSNQLGQDVGATFDI
jgi:hypothetical protein